MKNDPCPWIAQGYITLIVTNSKHLKFWTYILTEINFSSLLSGFWVKVDLSVFKEFGPISRLYARHQSNQKLLGKRKKILTFDFHNLRRHFWLRKLLINHTYQSSTNNGSRNCSRSSRHMINMITRTITTHIALEMKDLAEEMKQGIITREAKTRKEDMFPS